MEKWHEENLSSILEYPFDFERYMEEQLREIDDLDERIFAKKALIQGLSYIIRETENKYQRLEKRVYQEISIPDNAYEVVSTVVRQDYYDPTNETLLPVVPIDLSIDNCRDELSTEEMAYVGTIFLKANRETCKDFEGNKMFQGKATVDGEEKRVPVYIEKSRRYRNVIEQLYRLFQDNYLQWQTVNLGYLDKFYDIFVPKGEMDVTKIFEGNFTVDYEKYKHLVEYDMIPLWNIEQITFDSMDFMVPCLDGNYYENEFVIAEENRRDGYLIQINEDILEIRHEKEKIIIKSTKETFENWSAVRIVQKETIRSLDYKESFLTNRKQDTFIRRYFNESKVNLLTKSELFRKIMELDIKDYVEIVGYEILDNAADYQVQESMNWFVRDDLFPMEGRKVLLLTFREKEYGNYLNDSMVWFAVSQIQTEISEYQCVGRLEHVEIQKEIEKVIN